MPDRLELEGFADKAKRVLQDMANPKWCKADKRIPIKLLQNCEGAAFITIMKMGIAFLSGNVGGGCVIGKIRDPDHPRGWRWSGPVSIGCGGLGGGFVFGAEKIDSVIIFNTPGAMKAFMGDGKSAKQITLGANASLAAGPVGREAEVHAGGSSTVAPVAAYSYSKASGLYIGGTLEGAFLSTREDDNKKFYGDPNATSSNILKGHVQIPLKASSLLKELNDISDGTGDYAKRKLAASELYQSSTALQGGGAIKSASSNGKKLISRGLSSSDEDPLPSGWVVLTTDDGQQYYYNERLSKTTWDRPQFSSKPRPPLSVPSGSRAAPALAPRPAAVAARPPIPPRAPKPPPRAKPGRLCIAKFDYVAVQPDELSFSKGDAIRIIDDKSDPSWWTAESQGATGLVPCNYF